jgi:hypothetical protein
VVQESVSQILPYSAVHQGSISKQNRTKPYRAVLQIKVLQVSLTVHFTKPYCAVFCVEMV